MITEKDVKVLKVTSDSTCLQEWQTYYFRIADKKIVLVIKQDGFFKFWSANCKTLAEAKKHIVNVVNTEKTRDEFLCQF
jgi:hypothetical protein